MEPEIMAHTQDNEQHDDSHHQKSDCLVKCPENVFIKRINRNDSHLWTQSWGPPF